MYDYRITSQVAEAHRQDLLAEAKLHHLAKAARKARKPRRWAARGTPRRATPLAIAR